ncbi:ribosomal rna small subunit methyltransferase h [Quercus suber]|uniref:Ribosomal rna small subunit methyltransferase h n=1 Tax=Quercus suber TaxID=58331 RepID=A0AAW0LN64_QUESU
MAKSSTAKLFFLSSLSSSFGLRYLTTATTRTSLSFTFTCSRNITTRASKSNKKKQKAKVVVTAAAKNSVAVKEKRRTRSDKALDEHAIQCYVGDGGAAAPHIPVMLGEVVDVFFSKPLRSFVDCTVGAAGHSSAIIQAHPELKLYFGMDVDPVAYEKARARIDAILNGDSCHPTSNLKTHTVLKNFRHIKSVLSEVDKKLLDTGVDGILMDLGMSSMQASLRAEDILNSWPDTEVGRILREYGEESNWRSLQNKIVKARLHGGLHTTGEVADLIRNATPRTRGGRQGWIKTATRVFQALRIAVNDELKTLEDSLYSCFDCLTPGGRLAVISFHSLEDRIVKQTFLDIINSNEDDGDEEGRHRSELRKIRNDNGENEPWIKQMILGYRGAILTKRPITPSEEEERLNRRCRSAKLRVIQKVERE